MSDKILPAPTGPNPIVFFDITIGTTVSFSNLRMNMELI